MSATLKRKGYDVETTTTGEEAHVNLHVNLKENSFDLVLSDYKLSGMNGEELLKEVKSKNPELPVVLLTAYGSIERAVNAMRKGAYTYLTKPVNLNILLSVVREALRGRFFDIAERSRADISF